MLEVLFSINTTLILKHARFLISNNSVAIKDTKRSGFSPWVRKIPWRRKWQPTPVFLPGKSHGQRSLVGYSPWGHKELDTTEHTHISPLGLSDF